MEANIYTKLNMEHIHTLCTHGMHKEDARNQYNVRDNFTSKENWYSLLARMHTHERRQTSRSVWMNILWALHNNKSHYYHHHYHDLSIFCGDIRRRKISSGNSRKIWRKFFWTFFAQKKLQKSQHKLLLNVGSTQCWKWWKSDATLNARKRRVKIVSQKTHQH